MKNEEQREIVKFLVVLGIVILLIVGVYFFTRTFVTKEDEKKPAEQEIQGTVNYDMAIVGNMLSKPESKYYVFVYDYESKSEDMYHAMNAITKYVSSGKKDLLKVYNVELDNYMNKGYKIKKGEKSNPKAQTTKDFKFGDFTVLKIEKGKVVKYLENSKDIKKELMVK